MIAQRSAADPQAMSDGVVACVTGQGTQDLEFSRAEHGQDRARGRAFGGGDVRLQGGHQIFRAAGERGGRFT